jgi:hypothetical protein
MIASGMTLVDGARFVVDPTIGSRGFRSRGRR